MSNTVIIASTTEKVSGKLILTNYGRKRVLQRIAEAEYFEPFNFTHVTVGDKQNQLYSANITELGNETGTFPISDENVSLKNNVATIKTELDFVGNVTVQEIGLYETINNEKNLFAYASGFSLVKTREVTYDLIVNLSLSLTFENEHYKNYSVKLDDSEYALQPKMKRMFSALTLSQMDLERSIDINSRELGYHKAQVFMQEHNKTIECLRNILLLGRYEKTIKRLGLDSMTDCFYYPSEKSAHYSIKNLKDSTNNKYIDSIGNHYTLVAPTQGDEYFQDIQGNIYTKVELNNVVGFYKTPTSFVAVKQLDASVMTVSGDLQICNRDNIDLSVPMSLVHTTRLGTFSEESIILGKVNPNEDEYYFDVRIIYDKVREDYGLQFTIYCYDASKIKPDERKAVGHLRYIYFPTEEEKVSIANKEVMFSYLYNGDVQNPEVKMYMGTKLLNNTPERFINRTFNYLGPNQNIKDRCTLRNYTQTSSTSDFKKPMYYYIPGVENSSIFVFNKVLTDADIAYLALISQS